MNEVNDVNSRITLIVRDLTKAGGDWNYAARAETHVVFLESVPALRFALAADVELDIERIVVDRAGNADQLLDLLATLPAHFRGDVLYIREEHDACLSATGRGGDRMLYALRPSDVRFYLETHDLVTARLALQLSA